MTTAVSQDEGMSWTHIRDIENHAGYDSAYAAVTFVGGEALVTYYQRSRATARDSYVKLKILPIAWFTG